MLIIITHNVEYNCPNIACISISGQAHFEEFLKLHFADIVNNHFPDYIIISLTYILSICP